MSLLDSKPFKKSKWSSPYLDLQDPTWPVATIPSTDAWTLKLIFCFFFSDFLYHYLERPLVCQTQQAYSYLKAFTSFFHLTSMLFFLIICVSQTITSFSILYSNITLHEMSFLTILNKHPTKTRYSPHLSSLFLIVYIIILCFFCFVEWFVYCCASAGIYTLWGQGVCFIYFCFQ